MLTECDAPICRYNLAVLLIRSKKFGRLSTIMQHLEESSCRSDLRLVMSLTHNVSAVNISSDGTEGVADSWGRALKLVYEIVIEDRSDRQDAILQLLIQTNSSTLLGIICSLQADGFISVDPLHISISKEFSSWAKVLFAATFFDPRRSRNTVVDEIVSSASESLKTTMSLGSMSIVDLAE